MSNPTATKLRKMSKLCVLCIFIFSTLADNKMPSHWMCIHSFKENLRYLSYLELDRKVGGCVHSLPNQSQRGELRCRLANSILRIQELC